jgi:hypothetical protein
METTSCDRVQIAPGVYRPENWFTMTLTQKKRWIFTHVTSHIELVDDSIGSAFLEDGLTAENVLRGISYGSGAIAVIASGGTVVLVAGTVSVSTAVAAEALDDGPCKGERIVRSAVLGTAGAATAGLLVEGGLPILGRVAGGTVMAAGGTGVRC